MKKSMNKAVDEALGQEHGNTSLKNLEQLDEILEDSSKF